MNKLTVCAVVISGAFATQALAAPTAVQVQAINPSVCEISANQLVLDLKNPSVQNTATTNFTMKCNDRNGATVKMVSAEGGLEADDALPDDFALAYKATFTPDGLDSLTFTPPGGTGPNNFESEAKSYAGTTDLAGGISATLEVTNTQTAPWSGGYSDTITISITSN